MNHFLKTLLNLLQDCFHYMFWFIGCKACGILAPQAGIEPTPVALEGEVLATTLQGSPCGHFSIFTFFVKLQGFPK